MFVVSSPIVIAHRGASGYRPEHTLAAYELAIEQGADYVEPDVVSTKDGVLICRHENEISETTDVATHPEFADRKVTKIIDGDKLTGWFTEDFTYAEIQTLRAKERLPKLRPDSTAYDGKFPVPTLGEMLELVKAKSKAKGRPIGIYPETKHPSHFRALGIPLEEPLVALLDRPENQSVPVFIQSFEVENLKALHKLTKRPLVQLIGGVPPDRPDLNSAKLTSPEGLREIATYAAGIGPEKALVIPRGPDRKLGKPTDLVQRAHALGLKVHIWTLRKEQIFLPAGDGMTLSREIRAFVDAGIDGYFTDFPDIQPAPAS